MKRITLLFCILSVTSFIVSCADKGIPEDRVKDLVAPASLEQQPQAAQKSEIGMWQAEWEKIIQTARREGTLSIYTSSGTNGRKAITEGFDKKYGIKVEFTAGAGAYLTEKTTREYRAGLHMVDIYLSGTTSMFAGLKPANMLEPIEPILILPEVLDTKLYWDGKLPWRDKDKVTMATLAYPAPSLFANTALVKPDEISSYKDLLNPKLKGKIVMLDPLRPGSGEKWVLIMGSEIMGWDFIKELLKQDLMIYVDQPMMAQWLAQGKYAISIGVASEHVMPLKEAGAPITTVRPKEGTYLSLGSFAFAVLKNSPHPNAARLFANWVLSKEGQTSLATYVRQHGVRTDVPTDLLLPEFTRQPGEKYTVTDNDEYEEIRANNRGLVRKILEPYWR